jgi:hypothetical protein
MSCEAAMFVRVRGAGSTNEREFGLERSVQHRDRMREDPRFHKPNCSRLQAASKYHREFKLGALNLPR